MSQNRDAPAFQEYASAMLTRLPFRVMTLQQRGLLYTMRLECWVNVRLPHNPSELAKVLGMPDVDITDSLKAVMPFFDILDGHIICPDLENYRAYLADRKSKQSRGGKRGSAITNGKRKRPVNGVDSDVSSMSPSNPQAPRRGEVESSVQYRPVQLSQNQLSGSGVSFDPFVAAYESEEGCTADAYARASGGE